MWNPWTWGEIINIISVRWIIYVHIYIACSLSQSRKQTLKKNDFFTIQTWYVLAQEHLHLRTCYLQNSLAYHYFIYPSAQRRKGNFKRYNILLSYDQYSYVLAQKPKPWRSRNSVFGRSSFLAHYYWVLRYAWLWQVLANQFNIIRHKWLSKWWVHPKVEIRKS